MNTLLVNISAVNSNSAGSDLGHQLLQNFSGRGENVFGQPSPLWCGDSGSANLQKAFKSNLRQVYEEKSL